MSLSIWAAPPAHYVGNFFTLKVSKSILHRGSPPIWAMRKRKGVFFLGSVLFLAIPTIFSSISLAILSSKFYVSPEDRLWNYVNSWSALSQAPFKKGLTLRLWPQMIDNLPLTMAEATVLPSYHEWCGAQKWVAEIINEHKIGPNFDLLCFDGLCWAAVCYLVKDFYWLAFCFWIILLYNSLNVLWAMNINMSESWAHFEPFFGWRI